MTEFDLDQIRMLRAELRAFDAAIQRTHRNMDDQFRWMKRADQHLQRMWMAVSAAFVMSMVVVVVTAASLWRTHEQIDNLNRRVAILEAQQMPSRRESTEEEFLAW